MSYYTYDQNDVPYGVDSNGYFTDSCRTLFEDCSDGIQVKSGDYEGHYMYASSVTGAVMGDSQSVRTDNSWQSGGYMYFCKLQVDKYKGYFYSSGKWFEKRDFKFYKVTHPNARLVTGDWVQLAPGGSNATPCEQSLSVTYSKGFSSTEGSTKQISLTHKGTCGLGEVTTAIQASETSSNTLTAGKSISVNVKVPPGFRVVPWGRCMNVVDGANADDVGRYIYGDVHWESEKLNTPPRIIEGLDLDPPANNRKRALPDPDEPPTKKSKQ